MRKDPVVKVGQVYESCDKREHGRRIRVMEVATRNVPHSRYGSISTAYAYCQHERTGRALPQPIRCDRMYPHSTGWRLVEDVAS